MAYGPIAMALSPYSHGLWPHSHGLWVVWHDLKAAQCCRELLPLQCAGRSLLPLPHSQADEIAYGADEWRWGCGARYSPIRTDRRHIGYITYNILNL